MQTTPNKGPNPLTAQRHKKEMLWQIIFPVVVVGVLLVLVGALSAGLGFEDTRRWADISIIWLAASIILGLLIWLFTLILSVYALQKVIQILPAQSYRLQMLFLAVKSRFGKLGDLSVEPIFKARALSASVKRLFGFRFWR